MLGDATVLITGATGSVGTLRLFDANESGLKTPRI